MLSKTRCPIGSKKAIFNLLIKGGPAPQKCYARVWPGHRVPWKQPVGSESCEKKASIKEQKIKYLGKPSFKKIYFAKKFPKGGGVIWISYLYF